MICNKTTNDYYLHHKRDCKICLTWFDSRSSNKLPKDLNKKEMKERGTSNWWDNWVIERRSKSFLNADHFVARNILISLLLIFMFIMCSSSISLFLLQVVLVKRYLDLHWKRIKCCRSKKIVKSIWKLWNLIQIKFNVIQLYVNKISITKTNW